MDILATNRDWWSYRQLRALEDKAVKSPQLKHSPYYRPAISLSFTYPPPFQVGTEHHFEWRSKDNTFVIVSFHLIIHPTFAFFEPLFKISRQSFRPYPTIHCFWHDCPHRLDILTSHFIEQTLEPLWQREGLDIFTAELDAFFTRYYNPITPFSPPQNLYPYLPTSPNYSPTTSEVK